MILARAPLRISLGGGGTDLPSYYTRHGGFVLSAAIDKYVYIYVNRPAADDLLRIKYSRYEQVSSVDEIQHDLVRPSLKALKINGSLEIVSMADVPDGTGLGSSGSYLVALLTALYEFKRERVSTAELAGLAVHIEMELAGHPVGKQDHYVACFGGITCLEIDTAGKVRVSPVQMSITDGEELRRPRYRELVDAGFPDGIAADDGVGLHYVGTELREAVSCRPGAAAHRVTRAGEERLEARLIR